MPENTTSPRSRRSRSQASPEGSQRRSSSRRRRKHRSRPRDSEAQTWLRIGLLAIVMALTYFAFSAYPEYRKTGQQALIDPHFEQGLSAWTIDGNPYFVSAERATVTLEDTGRAESRVLKQRIETNYQPLHYRVSGEYRIKRVQQGEQPWHIASGALVFMRPDDSVISSHTFFFNQGSWDFRPFDQVVSIPASASHFEVRYRLLETTGEMQLRQLSLIPMAPNPYYNTLRFGLLALWLGFGLWALLPFARYLRTRPKVALSLGGVALLLGVGILLPEPWLRTIEAPLRALIPAFILQGWVSFLLSIDHVAPVISQHELSKLGHLLAFSALSCLALRYRHTLSFASMLALLILLAPLSETAQMFVNNRTPSLQDMYIDWLGIAIGCLVYALWRAFHPRPIPVINTRFEAVDLDHDT